MPYYEQPSVWADLGYEPIDPEQHLPKMTAAEGMALWRKQLEEMEARERKEHDEDEQAA